MGWLRHYLGYTNPGWAALWGGFISDIPIVAGVGMLWWKHTCHQQGCYRIARHTVGEAGVAVCRRHHPGLPDGKLTATHIRLLHQRGKP